MFCHKCGAKLVNGAFFCSKCGTKVPEEIIKEMQGTESSTQPVSNPLNNSPETGYHPETEAETVTKIKNEPEAEPAPSFQNDFKFFPNSDTEAEGKPETETVPKSNPAEDIIAEQKMASEPVREPVLNNRTDWKPVLDSEPETAPDPNHFAVPVPEQKAEPESESKPETPFQPVNLPEEKVYIPITVTYAQLEREESLVIRDDVLAEPMQITLRRNMKSGMQLRLKNAKTLPAANGAKQVAVIKLLVVGRPSGGANTTGGTAPGKSSQVMKTPAPARETATPVMEKTAPVKPAYSGVNTASRKAASFTPVSSRCNFQLCAENELVTGYKFGGADKGGAIDIAPEGLTIYQKSTGVALAFGAIGSAIEGKGKEIAYIRPGDISSFEKKMKNDHRIHLKDGRVLKVVFTTTQLESVLFAMDQFLSQI